MFSSSMSPLITRKSHRSESLSSTDCPPSARQIFPQNSLLSHVEMNASSVSGLILNLYCFTCCSSVFMPELLSFRNPQIPQHPYLPRHQPPASRRPLPILRGDCTSFGSGDDATGARLCAVPPARRTTCIQPIRECIRTLRCLLVGLAVSAAFSFPASRRPVLSSSALVFYLRCMKIPASIRVEYTAQGGGPNQGGEVVLGFPPFPASSPIRVFYLPCGLKTAQVSHISCEKSTVLIADFYPI